METFAPARAWKIIRKPDLTFAMNAIKRNKRRWLRFSLATCIHCGGVGHEEDLAAERVYSARWTGARYSCQHCNGTGIIHVNIPDQFYGTNATSTTYRRGESA